MKRIILVMALAAIIIGIGGQAVNAAEKPAYEIRIKDANFLEVIGYEDDNFPANNPLVEYCGYADAFTKALQKIEGEFVIVEVIPVVYSVGHSAKTKVLLVRVKPKAKLQ